MVLHDPPTTAIPSPERVRYWVDEGTGCQYEMASDALETFPVVLSESCLLRLLLLTYGVVYYPSR
jgi:hypothetical protein